MNVSRMNGTTNQEHAEAHFNVRVTRRFSASPERETIDKGTFTFGDEAASFTELNRFMAGK